VLVSGSSSSGSSEAIVSDLYFGTTYYWRAKAYNAVDTSAWSVPTEFTTANQLSNTSPADGAVNQDVELDIDWSYIGGLSGYLYEIDTVQDFSSPVLVSGSSSSGSSEAIVSDMYFGTTYYWRAKAYNAVDTSEWSNVTNFTTASSLSNHSPANGAMNVSVNPTIDWTYLSGLDGYICQVDTSLSFNSGHFQELTSSFSNSQTDVSGLLYGTTYYWRVAAYHAQDTSEWTSIWEFTTDYQLTDAPVLVSPADGSTDIPFDLVIAEWAAVAGAESYQYQYSTDETFETSVHSEITSLLTTNFTELHPQTTYFWRVRGANNTGYSPWSDVWSFTTESIPLEPPVLVSPADNATGLDPSEVFLVWHDVFGASEFDYQISPDSTFATGVTSGTENDTLVSLSGLPEETQFFWRVNSGDGTQESAWSETWSFTTGLYNNITISAVENIQFYPNPARAAVYFKNNLPEDTFVEILNNSGRIVLTQKIRSNRLNVSSLPAGTYLVRIHSADEYLCGKLVIY
ncbi:MAG: T9SS type A sorting domain-containing protein, partial [Bacteroidales bacterium]